MTDGVMFLAQMLLFLFCIHRASSPGSSLGSSRGSAESAGTCPGSAVPASAATAAGSSSSCSSRVIEAIQEQFPSLLDFSVM